MPQTGTVTATELRLRSTPTTNANNVVAALPRGTRLEILEDRGDWLKVTARGRAGFVSAHFVAKDEERPAADTQTSTPATQPASTSSPSTQPVSTSSQPAATGGPATGGQPSSTPNQPAAAQGAAGGQQPASAASRPLRAGPDPAPGSCKFVGDKAVTPDEVVFGKKFKLGIFNFGQTSIGQFVAANRELFPGVSPSRLRVMEAVSSNEGKLEAINTWDSAFLTFGCFQWTVGTAAGDGELPAMIDRLKRSSPQVFQKYFGQFGLDVQLSPARPNTLRRGFFTLDGTALKTPQQKEKLRSLDWAYRFWLSGQDDTVRLAEVEHAMDRVDLFFRCPECLINTRFVGDYVSSEYGIALLLDQHVNRPAHVPGTLARAVSTLVAQLGADAPQGWQDSQEQKLLALYLQKRAQTSMTDSDARAQKILAAVRAGLASDKRGSYEV